MNRFTASQSGTTVSHRQVVPAVRTAVLLVQLGTPAAPTAAALRPYLKQFLSDPRVVEIPKLLWQFILRGIILNVRPAKSAAKYASVWTESGSPLLANSQAQAAALFKRLQASGTNAMVKLAMRYGEPSVSSQLQALREQGVDHVVVLPMYPQYAAATTASVYDAVFDELKTWRNVPAIRTIRNFHDHDFYIDALAAQVRAHWARAGRAEKLVISFNGVPQRSLELGDPYFCECHKTGRLLAEALGLTANQFVITFQSRFGKAKWLEPYTAATVKALAEKGVKSVDLVCPGFVADCLETLEEVAMEVRDDFLGAGGKDYRYIPCLNAMPEFTNGLANLVLANLQGWPIHAVDSASQEEADRQRQERAREKGARA
jgi:protoporphyrin/coproporphyrin ferrochelatase